MNKVESRRPLAPPAPPRLLARARDNAGHTPARTQPNCGSSVKSVPHCPLAREAEITISPLSLFFYTYASRTLRDSADTTGAQPSVQPLLGVGRGGAAAYNSDKIREGQTWH
jgi:hypothetical protein